MTAQPPGYGSYSQHGSGQPYGPPPPYGPHQPTPPSGSQYVTAATRKSRPVALTVAGVAILTYAVATVVRLVIELLARLPDGDPIGGTLIADVVMWVIVTGVATWLGLKVLAGRLWAAITATVVLGLGLALHALVSDVYVQMASLSALMTFRAAYSLLGVVLSVVALCLLWIPGSSRSYLRPPERAWTHPGQYPGVPPAGPPVPPGQGSSPPSG